jgi:hypothetical protein
MWDGFLSDVVHVPFVDHMLVPVPDDVSPAAVASVSDNVADAYAPAPGLERCPAAPVVRREREGTRTARSVRTWPGARHAPPSTDPIRLPRDQARVRDMAEQSVRIRAAAHFGLEGASRRPGPQREVSIGPTVA